MCIIIILQFYSHTNNHKLHKIFTQVNTKEESYQYISHHYIFQKFNTHKYISITCLTGISILISINVSVLKT